MRQFLIALDQLCNTLLGGYADETMSSHAYRMHVAGRPWGFLMHAIDTIFFWESDHCLESYLSERARAQLPPEFRR